MGKLSDISLLWLIVKTIGLILAILVAFKIGPEAIWSENTGGLVLFDLIGGLFTIMMVAGFILPFLTDFGLLEFIGVFLTKFMRPIFGLPGRSAVDCLASWVGDGTIGVTITSKQYEDGYYTEREASTISTTFSAVSITFCLVVLETVGLTDYFGEFYLVVGVSGIIAALLVPRIYPLSKKTDKRLKNNENANKEYVPEGETRWS